MRTAQMTPARRLWSALVFCALAITFFVMAWTSFTQNRRIAENPHVSGRITHTWVTYGKSGGRFADVSFSGSTGGGSIVCQAAGLRIGASNYSAANGDSIDLAPIPDGGCARPDVPSAARAEWYIYFLAGLGVAFGLGGLKVFTAMPARGPRWGR
jgi:hypothetical protein